MFEAMMKNPICNKSLLFCAVWFTKSNGKGWAVYLPILLLFGNFMHAFHRFDVFIQSKYYYTSLIINFVAPKS